MKSHIKSGDTFHSLRAEGTTKINSGLIYTNTSLSSVPQSNQARFMAFQCVFAGVILYVQKPQQCMPFTDVVEAYLCGEHNKTKKVEKACLSTRPVFS